MNNSASNINHFPIYTLTPHTTRNTITHNKPLSVINPNHTRTHAYDNRQDSYSLGGHTHDHRYSLSYLIICMILSCILGLIVMQNYIITNQQISATSDGYVSTVFGEDYLYR